MRELHRHGRGDLSRATLGLPWLILLASIGWALPRPAHADPAVTPMAPSFPVGPYTSLYVDPADPRRVAVGTANGIVAWSEDAGATAVETQALSPRRYDASALRGTSTLSLIGRPASGGDLPLSGGRSRGAANRHPPLYPLQLAPSQRAIRLFIQAMRDGTRFPRWSFWMAVGAPYTDVSGLAMPPGTGRMLAASSAGVLVSDRGRGAWTRTLGGPGQMPGQRDLAALSVTIDPADPTRVLAGTVSGLYVSDDGGFTFAPHHSAALRDELVFSFQWDPTAPGTLFAIGDRIILRSDDAGRSFEPAFGSAATIFGVAFADGGAFVATSDGLVVVDGQGEHKVMQGRPVLGVSPWEGGVLLVTETDLMLAEPGGRTRTIARTSQDDPFITLRGGPGLAWALTSQGVYRVGGEPVRRQAGGRIPTPRTPPRLLLSLGQVETAVRDHLGLGDPTDTRLHRRWYAFLLPRVVADVTGGNSRDDGLVFDGTFPIRYHTASAATDGSVEVTVFAIWDLTEVIFGYRNIVNPNLVIESGLRDTRDRILHEVRVRYREAGALVQMLARPPEGAVTRARWRLRLEEHAAYLEALSGTQVVQGEAP